MEIKDIRKLAKMVDENDLSKFILKEGDFELQIEKGGEVRAPIMMQPPQMAAAAQSAPFAPQSSQGDESTAPDSDKSGFVEITSPIVGTFYRSSSPESDPYVNVGSEVQDESVVCIVEAMKVMNEIHAETSGIIREILVENATPVQFGQPLFLVEPR